MELPVFLPGQVRDWTKVGGKAEITDDGKIVITVSEESAKALIEMAKNNILLQLAFDYRASDAKLAEIHSRYRVE